MTSNAIGFALVVVAVLSVAGAAALVAPHAMQRAALRSNERIRGVPLFGWLAYTWVRRPEYIATTRVVGALFLMMALLLALLLAAAWATPRH